MFLPQVMSAGRTGIYFCLERTLEASLAYVVTAVGGHRLEHQLLATHTKKLVLYTTQEVLQEVGEERVTS